MGWGSVAQTPGLKNGTVVVVRRTGVIGRWSWEFLVNRSRYSEEWLRSRGSLRGIEGGLGRTSKGRLPLSCWGVLGLNEENLLLENNY